MKFILGVKENMTEYFSPEGEVFPVTVISAGPIVVTQIKTKESDGYNAIQFGFGKKNPKNINKAIRGHIKDLGDFKYIKEFQTDEKTEIKVGDIFNVADLFSVNDKLQISSISKGKGFQGVVKRHGFHGGPRTHGQKHSEREPGSIGAGGMQKVMKGKRMGGRMGGDRITQKNLKIIFIDKENNTMLIKGAIPGRRGSLVEIKAITN
ncbi:MAG: 50S ribosomal protein L3 [Patescibacteria group bacterium]